MRSRFVIPAALLVTVAYVKGRLDASLLRQQEARVPVATPLVDPMLRAQAEAEDAMALAEAQTAATAVGVEHPAPRDLSHLSEWLTIPSWTPAPRRTRARDVVVDPARLAEWATNPTWGEVRRARTRDAFEAAVLAEWVAQVAPTVVPQGDPAPEPEPVAEEPVAEEIQEAPPDAAPVEVEIDETGRFSLGGWAAQPGHMALCGVTFRDRRDRPVDPASIRLSIDAATNVGEGGLVVLSDPGFAPDAEGFTVLLAAEGHGSFAATGRYEVVAD